VRENERISRETILNFSSYFGVGDMFAILSRRGIVDRELILNVLDGLNDEGLICREEVGKDIWAYKSIMSFDPNSRDSKRVEREIRRRELGIHLIT